MSENRQWIPLSEAVADYMDEAQQSNHNEWRLWHFAFRCLTELGLDAFYTTKSVKLPVNSNLTVTLPADYLNYSKVGVLNQQGDIIPMGVNNNMTTAFDLSPNRLTQTEDNTLQTQITEQGTWWYNYWNGQAFGPIYGLPSGTPVVGTFKIDNANGVIVLSPEFNYPYVMLEYTASPTPNNDYYIPIQFKEAVIAYIAWRDIRSIPSKTHVHNSNVGMRRHDYYNERRLAIARYDPVRLAELYQWNLTNQRLTVKA